MNAPALLVVGGTSVPPIAKQPWLKFFPSDWRSDPKLRACSLAARGLWVEIIGLMHEATPYGHLLINGQSPNAVELARQVGATAAEVRRALDELRIRDVFSTTDQGVIFSRKLVRKGRLSVVGHETGKRGGNPALLPSQPLTGTLNGSGPQPLRVVPTGGDNPQRPEARGQNPLPPAGALSDAKVGEWARQFLEDYPAIYARCRSGAFYRVREARDFPVAVQLAHDYQPLTRLQDMLELFLRRKDTGEMGKPGSPRQFAHYAPDCDRMLRENGR